MKKIYFEPETFVEDIRQQAIICTSDISGADGGPGSDIDYGGIDDEGLIDPTSWNQDYLWDEDE